MKKNKKGLITALAVAGVGAGIGAGVAIARKIKSSNKEGIIENFSDYLEGIQGSKGANDTDNKFKQTMFFRKNRANKKIPKGIKGEK